jgi:hypothetical protein
LAVAATVLTAAATGRRRWRQQRMFGRLRGRLRRRFLKKRTLLMTMVFCLAVHVASAREVVRFHEDDYKAHLMAAITRAAGALPIDPKDGDQVRVWFNSPMGRSIRGFILTRKGVWRCSLRYQNDNGEYLVFDGGTCAGPRRFEARLAKPLAQLAEAARLDGKILECGTMDGWTADVEGIFEGKRFAFYAANTQDCEEEEIRWAGDFLDLVAAAYYKKDD